MIDDKLTARMTDGTIVNYAWMKIGKKVFCAWCAIDKECVVDPDLHIQRHCEVDNKLGITND